MQGLDESIGHIDDFIVDDTTWEVRYLVVDTGNWWFGKKVLVEPRWALRVSWEDGKIFFDLSRQAIKDSPRDGRRLNRHTVRWLRPPGVLASWRPAGGRGIAAPSGPRPRLRASRERMARDTRSRAMSCPEGRSAEPGARPGRAHAGGIPS
ncbi:MAG: PRC-barrel domain-containing protein [bacterium]|nr:PRC-barrel domain-containing protein [bacterium]